MDDVSMCAPRLQNKNKGEEATHGDIAKNKELTMGQAMIEFVTCEHHERVAVIENIAGIRLHLFTMELP